MFIPGSENYINKLRIVGDVDDGLAFRLRLQSLLSSTDFSIPGVSPAAVVCIRSMPDPRPRTLRLVRSELEGAGVWSEALTQALAGKVSRAARPANGLVPGNAECVLFADKAELLASLAGDWLSGLVWTRWWWKILLPAGDFSEIVKQLWRDHPEYVPAALDRLEGERKAAEFVMALTDDDCRELLQQIVRSFAIQELNTVCKVSLPADDFNLSEVSAGSPSGSDPAAQSFERKVFTAAPAPWRREPSTSNLAPERQRFLGIALTIARAPSSARTKEFARAVERWQEEITNGIQRVRTNAPEVKRGKDELRSSSVPAVAAGLSAADNALPPSTQSAVLAVAEDEERRLTRDLLPLRTGEPSLPKTLFSDSNIAGERRARAAAFDNDSFDSINERRPEFVTEMPGEHAAVGELLPLAPADPLVAEPPPVQPATLDLVAAEPCVVIETQLGGLFYLINLALYLNLYGDFTMPAAPGIELNIWDFVALVGAELAPEKCADDPIWSWLAKMSGREEGQRAGASFDPGDEWRLPPEWLSEFTDKHAWQWSASRGRLRVAHPEAFIVLDLPLANDAHEQLRGEIEAYGISMASFSRRQLRTSAALHSKSVRGRALRRWLSLLMLYVRARVRVALGSESDDAAARSLLRHDARVRATDTHVDVFLSLQDLPLEIRFAGLDRDPGWVPAAGRFIAFHFN